MIDFNEAQAVYKEARLLYSQEQVNDAFDRMGRSLDRFAEEHPIFLGVMIGGMIPLSRLLSRIAYPVQVDYLHATRFNNSTMGGELTWKREPEIDLSGRTVVLVDDILDRGITLAAIRAYCLEKKARLVCTVVLINKQTERAEGGLKQADIVGLNVPDEYVFGCGMDYKGSWRHLPGVYATSKKVV